MQTQNSFYAISDTGVTITPGIATEAICLLVDVNEISGMMEIKDYYELSLHDAAGKEICSVDITKDGIQMRDETILDKYYPASNSLYRIRIDLLSIKTIYHTNHAKMLI